MLARNADPGPNGGVVSHYVYTGFSLSNSGDEIFLTCGGTVIDRVTYAGSTGGVSTLPAPS